MLCPYSSYGLSEGSDPCLSVCYWNLIDSRCWKEATSFVSAKSSKSTEDLKNRWWMERARETQQLDDSYGICGLFWVIKASYGPNIQVPSHLKKWDKFHSVTDGGMFQLFAPRKILPKVCSSNNCRLLYVHLKVKWAWSVLCNNAMRTRGSSTPRERWLF